MAEMSKKNKKMAVFGIFGGCGGSDPKVMGTIEFGLSRLFFWHLAKADWTIGYGDIGVQLNKSPKKTVN